MESEGKTVSGLFSYGNPMYSFQAKMEGPRKENEKNILEVTREGHLGDLVS